MVNKKLMEFFLNSDELLEALSEVEHKQWMVLTSAIADTEKISPERLARWKESWVPYEELTEDNKDFDRTFALSVINVLKRKLL